MKKVVLLVLTFLIVASFALTGCVAQQKVDIKVLILPKFELGEMTGDDVGEAQLYYEHYLKGASEYDVPGNPNKLYVKDGVALLVTDVFKSNAGTSVAALLQDDRFDFSNTYFLNTGCGGGSAGTSILGDVVISSGTVDYEVGYVTDSSDLKDPNNIPWFIMEENIDDAYKKYDANLVDKVYELVKDVPLATTDDTKAVLAKTFPEQAWAQREPKVLRGTSVTSDSYWKGQTNHDKAVLICNTYRTIDPYAVSEMEDIAVAVALERVGKLDHMIQFRDIVNMDVFMYGDTPEKLWKTDSADYEEQKEDHLSYDIFSTARENNFKVGSIIIDAILDGRL